MQSEPSVQRYELVQCIARGGMGEVFRGRAFGAHGFRKDIAIKRILPGLSRNSELEQRFISEAHVAATLTHANIVQVLDFGHDGEALFLAMELVDGCDLATLVSHYKGHGVPVPLSAAMHVAIGACNGLDFAHRRGVLHRDVSGSNLLLSRAGEVKIADFGLAKVGGGLDLTGHGRIIGKASYMSPEQTRGEELDPRSDQFSLGVVIHELVTGERLFAAKTAELVFVAVQQKPIPPPSQRRPDIPIAFDQVVLRALERDRDARYPSCADFARALTEACYASQLVHTARDLAELVGRVGGSDPRPEEATAPTADELPTQPTKSWVRIGVDAGGMPQWTRTTRAAADQARTSEPHRRRLGIRIGLAVAGFAMVAGIIAVVASSGSEPGGESGIAEPAMAESDRPIAEPARADAAPSPGATAGPAGGERAEDPDGGPESTGVAAAPDSSGAGEPAMSAEAPPPRKTATIALYVEPWAHVYIDGKKRGTTPIPRLRLPVGSHRLRLVNPELDKTKIVTVKVPHRGAYSFSLVD